jgi:hypothetical protein
MKKGNIFYLIFILTILAIRTWVFFFPQKKLIINGMAIHHFWIGAIIILSVLLLLNNYNRLKSILFPIGLGLTADELTFIVLGGGTVRNYWSAYSVFGTLIILIVIFLTRKKIMEKI